MSVFLHALPLLILGTKMTVLLTGLVMAGSTLLALPLAFARLSAIPVASRGAAAYSWVVRSLPALVVLYFAFYALPESGVQLTAFEAAWCGLTLVNVAFIAEIVRAGLLSVPASQREAARALGMSPLHTFRRVVLPQAMPAIIPPYISNATIVTKGTSLASIITVNELTGNVYALISQTYRSLQFLAVAVAVYLAINTLLIGLQMYGERRWRLP